MSLLAIIVITLAIVLALAALASLLALHFLSPEYDPSWRMISEYALGKHKNVLTTFFIAWGISTVLAALVLWGSVTGVWATIGILLVIVSGVGAIMGGLFDVKHPRHGLAFLLGVPTLPVGALLVSYTLTAHPQQEIWRAHDTLVLLSAHATWVSLVLMGIAMMHLMASFKKAGVTWDQDSPPPENLPPGVTSLAGYAGRFLIFVYLNWVIVMMGIVLIHGTR